MAVGSIGVIGYGNMGSAIIGGLSKIAGIMPSDIHVHDSDSEKLAAAKNNGHFTHSTIEELGKFSETVIIAVKPKDVGAVIACLKGINSIELVISVAAGISTESIESILTNIPVIRAMPNTPCMVGAGAIVISRGLKAEDEHAEKAKTILGSAGIVVELPEDMLDAVTGLSGSGPAYVAMMIEALSDGGVKMGIPRQTALILAAQTVLGTAKMILKNNMHPAKLRDMVASPGGTTIEGISVLENGAFRGLLIDAVEAATIKSKELGY